MIMPQKVQEEKELRPPQHQDQQPGFEHEMKPRPKAEDSAYRGSGKLEGKLALITGGDSGIGRAVAIAFAKEGADVIVAYLNEHQDAKETKSLVEKHGGACTLLAGDIADEEFCRDAIEHALEKSQKLDILVNNAAVQYPQESIEDITSEQLSKTFRTNIFAMFYLIKYALPHMQKGSAIINTTSVTAYRGSPHLIDYAATKGAIVSMTRSLAHSLVEKGIRVNAVAPGPIWTPLIPASFPADKVAKFGSDVPMGRAGEPEEVAASYVFLASDDSSYMTGQVLHPNGGEIVNG
jgi:NAD(P)-dependent dehydrogenase (short-subunit alcohol dehydrogenase family)